MPEVALTTGFDSWLVLVPGHTKDFQNCNGPPGPCLHGIQHEVGTNITGWSGVSIT